MGADVSEAMDKGGIEFRQVRFEGGGRSHPVEVWRSGAEDSQVWFKGVGQWLAR